MGTGASRDLLIISLNGHLTIEYLETSFGSVEPLDAGYKKLLVDASQLESYSPDAKELFVNWNRAHREQLKAVAVVTDNTLWHMVVLGMSFAANQVIKPFSTRHDAMHWLKTQPAA